MNRILQELKQTVSASRLNTFHQCRLKFFFRYVAEIQKPGTPALFVGKTVHSVLQGWNLARWRGEPRGQEFFRAMFEALWSDPESNADIRWRGEEDQQKATAWSMIEAYFQQTPIPKGEKPQGVEVAIEADLIHRGLTKLVGIIDLVRPGGRIVDFKTTSITPSPERTSHQNGLQLTCYGLLYREATGQRESGFELHHLVKLKQPKVVIVEVGKVTQAQESRLYRSVESYLTGLENQDFVPSPGLSCMGCEYFRECKAWAGNYVQRKLAA